MAAPKMSAASTDAWTSEDFQMCVNLMRRAKAHGKYQEVLDYLEESTEWSVIPTSGYGSMNDASKRQREEPREPRPMYHAPPPVSEPMPSHAPLHLGTSSLPPGVPSLARWGQSLIGFGKLKHKVSYLDFRNSVDEDDTSYKSYLCSHYKSGSAPLRDLVDYLKAAGDPYVLANLNSQAVLIPGSTHARRFQS